ncbi:MAG: aa3-type cytochrome c oxidase subunit IV [Paracoccaceae bacterium]
MAEHEHGTMDIKDHERTFHGFIRVVTWATIAAIVILIFMALVNA